MALCVAILGGRTFFCYRTAPTMTLTGSSFARIGTIIKAIKFFVRNQR